MAFLAPLLPILLEAAPLILGAAGAAGASKLLGSGGNKATQDASAKAAEAQAGSIEDDARRKREIEALIARLSAGGRPDTFRLPDEAGGQALPDSFSESIGNTARLDALMALQGIPTNSNALVNATNDSTRRDVANSGIAGSLGGSLEEILNSIFQPDVTQATADVGSVGLPDLGGFDFTFMDPALIPSPTPPEQPLGPGA